MTNNSLSKQILEDFDTNFQSITYFILCIHKYGFLTWNGAFSVWGLFKIAANTKYFFKYDKPCVVLWLYNNTKSHHRAGQRIALCCRVIKGWYNVGRNAG